jgi:hypothetical protein
MSTAPSSHALAVDRFCSGELHHASCALLGKPVLTREQTVAAPPGVATLVEGVVFWSRFFATCSLPGLYVGHLGEVRAKAQRRWCPRASLAFLKASHWTATLAPRRSGAR